MNPHTGLVGAVRRLVRKLGYDVVHNQDFGALLEHLEIDLLIDVGANLGQTYDKFRLIGYRGPIASFEPHPDCFQRLRNRPDKYGNWARFNIAVGSEDAEKTLYLAPVTDQTSLLTNPAISSSRSITVHVCSLDNLWSELEFDRHKRIFLKIDAEGFDFRILQGARKHFDQIVGGMLESRPVPEYDSESPMNEVLTFLSDNGFVVCRMDSDSIIPGLGICTGFNVTFCRRNILLELQKRV